MSDVIVDTNVAVVANRQNPQVASDCADACVQFLAAVQSDHVVLIDSGDEIRAEYAQALHLGRPFQLGAQFLFHILQQQFNSAHVRRVDLEKDAAGDFVDFPAVPDLAAFDRSDRKFAAIGRKTATPVTNAVDSDWADHLAALNASGIVVNFLCGSDKGTWFEN